MVYGHRWRIRAKERRKERKRADYLTEKISSPDSIEFLLLPQNDAFHYSKIPSALDPTSSGNHISNGNGDGYYASSDSHDALESSLADL
ncbi:hypothetical protein DVH24_016298 [Malus domestica]|uniref:Uncharacterized protein n=1 Tax=Malus domestica TaxID=3750 RepID=A0A498HPU3_MALDO|nr:hypothetical protein DVH24_016298 [Malus domestica]